MTTVRPRRLEGKVALVTGAVHSMTACSGVAQMLSTTRRACSRRATFRQ